jgi:hypothetical protein
MTGGVADAESVFVSLTAQSSGEDNKSTVGPHFGRNADSQGWQVLRGQTDRDLTTRRTCVESTDPVSTRRPGVDSYSS